MLAPLDQVRLKSKLLFGGTYRIEVAAAVAAADPGVVTVGGIVEALELPAELYTTVRAELEILAKAELLMRLPRPRGQRVQEYERMPSAYWDASRQLIYEFAPEIDQSVLSSDE